MPKIHPDASILIDDYIQSGPDFSRDICMRLRELIHQAYPEVVEDWKWRTPVFHANSMVCAFAGFKKHVSLSFFHGAQMRDAHGLFTDDCSAQNSRTIKFSDVAEIDDTAVIDYLKEAFLLNLQGVKSIQTPKVLVIPDLLTKALNENPEANSNFLNMAKGYKREYAEYISEAKREATKLRRIEKVISNLKKGVTLNAQYKC